MPDLSSSHNIISLLYTIRYPCPPAAFKKKEISHSGKISTRDKSHRMEYVIVSPKTGTSEYQIKRGIVKYYSDKDIINELKHMFGAGVQSHYIEMLRTSCNSFDQDFFNTSYKMLIESLDYISQENFLDIIEMSDQVIGNGSSMGEKKSFVLN